MKYLLLFFALACTAIACSKEGPVGPKGPVGVSYTWPPSEINGFTFLGNQFGDLLPASDSVLVRTYNGKYWFSTYSDKRGFWQLRKMPPGNYDISFTKPGYDSLHIFVQHAGGQEPKFVGDDTLYASLGLRVSSVSFDVVAASASMVQITVDVYYAGATDSLHPSPLLGMNLLYYDSGVVKTGRTGYNLIDANGGREPGHLHASFTDYNTFVPHGDSAFVNVYQSRSGRFPYTYWYNYATDAQVLYPYPSMHFSSPVKIWP